MACCASDQINGLHSSSDMSAMDSANERPNILVVVLDDVRFDDLAFSGHPFVQTPSFDRVANEGMRFANAFAPIPLCSPNRACILTGQYAHSHGIIDNADRGPRSHQLVTFPMALQRAGYETAFVGKWHMGLDDSPRPGFDEWLSFRGQGHYFDPEVNDNGNPHQLTGYATDLFSERVADFIRRRRDRPFLAYLSHKAVHPNLFQGADGSIRQIPEDGGFTPPPWLSRLYEREPIPRRPNTRSYGHGKRALERPIEGVPPLGPSTGTPDHVVRNRLRILTAADQSFASVLGAVEETGQAENTVILLTSDHGYFYGEHGLNEERRLAYEESIRVPLAVRWPARVTAGSVANAFALSVDIAPTLLELAGAEPLPGIHGRSLLPLLDGWVPPDWRRSALIEYFSDAVWPRVANMGYQAVRTERWKYIRYTELAGMDELYDLEVDPYEMRNLINEAGLDETKAELQAELQLLLRASSGQ